VQGQRATPLTSKPQAPAMKGDSRAPKVRGNQTVGVPGAAAGAQKEDPRTTARMHAVRAISWVLKALAMRGHKRADDVAELLLRLLAGSNQGGESREEGVQRGWGEGVWGGEGEREKLGR